MASASWATEQATAMYDGSVLTEDVTWSGSVLVKGTVVVAPQATLRIEPGTVVRFAASATQPLPNLVVQGRIHAAGTSERPVVFTSDRSRPARGAWGGVVLLATEKRNVLERCRIEYAETGVDLRFSAITLKWVSITQSKTAVRSHDGIVQMSGSSVTDCVTGIEMHNSELDCKDCVVASCQRGCVLNRSSAVFASPKITNNQQTGLEADDCRLKISNGDVSGNVSGSRIKGGEGQITMTRFHSNRQTALHLIDTRIRVQRCLFTENSRDAVRMEDGRPLLLHNAFTSNGGYNLYNAGRDEISALQNWWGGSDPAAIKSKIYDSHLDEKAGAVQIYPWLNEKPPLMP
jgi:hypothetical protein